jgi:hypothetical protein
MFGICTMGRKKKLKKVCCDWKVQEQNLVSLELAIKEQMLLHQNWPLQKKCYYIIIRN